MRRTAVRLLLAAMLIGLGWAAAKAQSPQTDFELVVDAPGGDVSVTCAKECDVACVGLGVPSHATLTPTQTLILR